jgi:hypothetical protein
MEVVSVSIFSEMRFVLNDDIFPGAPISTANNLQVGETDTNWRYSFGATTGFVLVGGAGDAWKQFSADANWVSPPLVDGSHQPGNYTFSTQFTLDNEYPDTYSLNAEISSDNELIGITLNSLPVDLVTPCADSDKSYTCTTRYKFTDFFVTGMNTLTFVVNNKPYVPASMCRTGIYVEFV